MIRALSIAALAAAGLSTACMDFERGDGEATEVADTRAELTKYALQANISLQVPARLIGRGQPYCTNGEEPYSLSVNVCHEPLEGSCTTYFCPDPTGGPPTLASIFGGGPNPVCAYSDMQTEPCTNSYDLPERMLPSRKQWMVLVPQLFGPDFVDAPFVDPKELPGDE